MVADHTPLPWKGVGTTILMIESADIGAVVGGRTPSEAEANVRRIIACVEYCEGIDTELLVGMGTGSAFRARDINFNERTAHGRLIRTVLAAFGKKPEEAEMRTDGVYDHDLDGLALKALREFVEGRSV